MERLLLDIAGASGLADYPLSPPTLSVGLAGLGRRGTEQTLNECDVAMYAAKNRGGNQVVVFGDEVRKFAGSRRELAAAISELSETNKRLHKEARTDVLTGLPNRRALVELEDHVFGGPNSAWGTGALLFIDVDHFGNYNHVYGDTPAGDAALKKVAEALTEIFRGSDLVFRKGGEEFVVILLETDLRLAEQAAERIRRKVQSLGIPHSGSDQGVLTVTVGVSCGASARTIGQCLAEASDLVMAAKRNERRNQVHVPRE